MTFHLILSHILTNHYFFFPNIQNLDHVFSISLSPSFTIQRDGLQELEEGLDRSDFERKIEENKQKTKVHLEIPKFKIESEIPLNGILKNLGMTKMFKPGMADFRGVSNIPLHVSEVMEKALIEVDETGTEAAAATAVIGNTRIGPIPPKLFVADHPFLFFVRDLRTKLLLFQGRVTVPSQE